MNLEEFEMLKKAAAAGLLQDLGGQHFSMTGVLSMKRVDMVKLILACGGAYDERPGWGTNYLIVGKNRRPNTTKMEEAKSRGTTTITELDFVRMITPS